MARFGNRRTKNTSSKTSTRQPSKSTRACKLSFETLEPRQMLAADMAEIIGLVQTDLQGDVDASNDVVVVGATATLYRDGGNGIFGGDDSIAGTTSTNAQGQYRFDLVDAGKYFIKISLPADLQFRPGEDVREVNISVGEGQGITGPAIDGFTSEQKVETSPPLPASQPSHLTDSDVLGGERDMFVELTEGTDKFSSVSLISGTGLLRLNSDSEVTGNAKIVWDGVDANALAVNATGLRGTELQGIDLTRHEGNTMTGIALTSGADHPDAKITMRIYTDAANWSEFTTTVPESSGGKATGQAIFRFDDVPTAKSGSGANFTNVGALELTFEGVSAVDGQVALVGLVGRATKRADFTASPRLSVGDRVWADEDDDGLLDAGELGIAGVKLNLYEDIDGNNQYTNGVDALMGMTNTDANGNYLFNNLFPGKYVVQVDPTNFQTTGPLNNLVSSSGNDPVADPDDNVNNDDNGTALAGAGVVSQAVTLTGNAEPTNDGDSNSNSNRTVDFGFFGFDLVLDKAVEQTAVSPEETIEYTIKINNDGPSDAANTTFEDILPSHVTFVSGSTSLAGVGVQHASGVVTASLGTMKNGDVVFITIFATVNDNAVGTLVNRATVIAPKEVNLSNNTDEVSNPVTPKIDLAITKTDSRDPVEPGSVFSYTLSVVNNGPSDATGVVVTDSLPAHVSFVSATPTQDEIFAVIADNFAEGTSTTKEDLVFELGDLARGESTVITIDVRVDSDFTGQLLNRTRVRGNEAEITLANNEDTEPTLVSIDPASLAGSVFVDRNDNGTFDDGERPLGNVIVSLKGIDITGATVIRSTVTKPDGSYLFENLTPGTYRLVETQPSRFRDGKDHIGTNGGAHGENPGPLLIPNDVDPQKIQDLFMEINLSSGDAAEEYDFGEQAVSVSKINFIRPANW